MKRLEYLKSQILNFQDHYYNHQALISDEEYDLLINQYEFECSNFGVTPDLSVVKNVGSPVVFGKKYRHKIPMGSLNKIRTEPDLQKFYNTSNEFLVLPKFNGISVQLEIKNGVLVRALTRGDGFEGLDITNKVEYMTKAVMKEFTGFLRGEIIMTNNSWNNFIHKSLYKNQLNCVIGVCNSDFSENNIDIYRQMTVIYFNWFTEDGKQNTNITNLIKFQSHIIENFKFCSGLYSYPVLENLYREYSMNFPVDGVVLTPINSEIEYDKNLYPTNQVAVKFIGDTKIFEVEKVNWQVSRRGKLCPVAIFKKAKELSGVSVKQATAFNYKFVTDNWLGSGAEVEVVRSGEIIPYILRVVKQAPKLEEFNCQSCNSDLSYVRGVDLYCGNKNCRGIKIAKLSYFLSSLGFENFSYACCEALTDTGFNIFNLLEITKEDLSNLENWGEIKSLGFLEEIDSKLRNIDFLEFLVALGIEGVSKTLWETILNSVECKEIFNLSEEELNILLSSIPNIGPARRKNIIDGIIESKPIFKIYETFIEIEPRIINLNSTKLKGKKFQFTGKIEGYSREQLERLTLSNGGQVGSRFDVLVTDVDKDSSKKRDAVKRGAKIMSSQEFLNLLV